MIKSDVKPDKWAAVETKLHQLWNSAKELFGAEESVEIVDDASIFLLRLFLDQKIAMIKHTTEMRKIFGQFTNQQVNKICTVSRSLLFYFLVALFYL